MTEHTCIHHPRRQLWAKKKKKKNRMKIQLEIRHPIPASLAMQLVGFFEEPSLLGLVSALGLPL